LIIYAFLDIFKKSILLWRVDDEIQNVFLIFSLSFETSPTRECVKQPAAADYIFGG